MHEDRKVAVHDPKARAWEYSLRWSEANQVFGQRGTAVSNCGCHSAMKGRRQEYAVVGASEMQGLAEREAGQAK